MTEYIISLTPLTLLPVFVFMCITTLSIIGNVLRALSFNTTGATVWVTLWYTYACTGPSSCLLYDQGDLGTLLGGSSECSSLVSHYRTAEAFGIITSFFSGAATLLGIALIVQQRSLTSKVVGRIGLLLSVGLLLAQLIQFILFITIKDRQCLIAIASPTLGPAPFMYLGAVFLAMVNCGLYLRIGQTKEGAAAPSGVVAAPQTVPSPQAPRYVPQPQQVQQMVAVPSASNSFVAERSFTGSRAIEQRPAMATSPIRVRSPNNRARTPVSTEEGLWPDGDDWQIDEPSGLLWSETKHLFFDRSSGQFYDPKSDQWFDPDANRWYKLAK